MPGVTLHLLLADRVVHRWRALASGAPFDIEDATALNAFHLGAIGPDLGYFPGGCRVLSDLAHCVRTGVLARVLLRSARTLPERAFALGWLTHFLADRAIHPWIGRGVGELTAGSRTRFVDGSSNPLAHLRVEMGLDAWFAERHPHLRRRRLSPVFGPENVAFLVRAYAVTYGVRIPAALFLRSHRAATRRAGQALAGMTVMAALMRGEGLPAASMLRWMIRAVWQAQRLRSIPLAYLNPVPPSRWLLTAVSEEVEQHPDVFIRHADRDAADLQDFNLDTGRPLAQEGSHPGTRRALAALSALAGERRVVGPGYGHPTDAALTSLLLHEQERLQEA